MVLCIYTQIESVVVHAAAATGDRCGQNILVLYTDEMTLMQFPVRNSIAFFIHYAVGI